MHITPEEQIALRQSFERLRSDFDAHSTFFYEAFFRRAPETRAMFRDDLTGQGMKFMTTLGEVIQHVQEPDENAERLADLGSVHASLGVHADYFAPMEEALMETLGNALGSDFTPELEQTWRKAYAALSATMIRKSRIA